MNYLDGNKGDFPLVEIFSRRGTDNKGVSAFEMLRHRYCKLAKKMENKSYVAKIECEGKNSF